MILHYHLWDKLIFNQNTFQKFPSFPVFASQTWGRILNPVGFHKKLQLLLTLKNLQFTDVNPSTKELQQLLRRRDSKQSTQRIPKESQKNPQETLHNCITFQTSWESLTTLTYESPQKHVKNLKRISKESQKNLKRIPQFHRMDNPEKETWKIYL